MVGFCKTNWIVLLCASGPRFRSRYNYSLLVGEFGDRITVGARFSVNFLTGPVVHTASCRMTTGSPSRGKVAGA